MNHQGFGQLDRSPHPLLLEILYWPALEEDVRHLLRHMLRIDAAHLLMLASCKIIPEKTAARLLAVNRELKMRHERGDRIFTAGPQRGLYLALEGQYIATLGVMVGGAIHVARSRNDINATVTRMRLREELLALLEALAGLLASDRLRCE